MPDAEADDEYEDDDHDDADEDESSRECPFCGSEETCPHLLLTVDKTFRTAEGGVLMDAFNERWNLLVEEGGERFNEYGAFLDLLLRVATLSDGEREYSFDGPPGMSSTYVNFYGESEIKLNSALQQFTANR